MSRKYEKVQELLPEYELHKVQFVVPHLYGQVVQDFIVQELLVRPVFEKCHQRGLLLFV